MFYDTKLNNHGLSFNPFKSCVIPRPIAWITSFDEHGVLNLAPYSYFNIVTDTPPMIMFSTTSKHPDGGLKDTLQNVETTKEFVVNLTSWDLREEVSITSGHFDRGISEVEMANLETLPSKLVKPPRVKISPIQLECVYYRSVQLPIMDDQHTNRMVIARVVGVHIEDNVIIDGKIDITKFRPISRMGYNEYAVIQDKFAMERPSEDLNLGLIMKEFENIT